MIANSEYARLMRAYDLVTSLRHGSLPSHHALIPDHHGHAKEAVYTVDKRSLDYHPKDQAHLQAAAEEAIRVDGKIHVNRGHRQN